MSSVLSSDVARAMPMRESVVIGMGELRVSRSPQVVLSCIGLGSCIAVCMYDGTTGVGGLVHVVLPKHDGRSDHDRAKYADTAVPLLLGEIIAQGGSRSRTTARIAGGSQMTLAPGLNATFRTGEKNLAEVLAALQREGMRLAGSDTGGSRGRTVRMYLDTGRVTVKTIGGDEREI